MVWAQGRLLLCAPETGHWEHAACACVCECVKKRSIKTLIFKCETSRQKSTWTQNEQNEMFCKNMRGVTATFHRQMFDRVTFSLVGFFFSQRRRKKEKNIPITNQSRNSILQPDPRV